MNALKGQDGRLQMIAMASDMVLVHATLKSK